MGKVVKSVLQVAAIAVNFIPGIGQIASLAISAALTLGASQIKTGSKAPRNSPENANRLRANIDPLTPRKTVVGVTALATDIRDEEFTNNQEFFHRFIVCASHKVQSIDEIWFDDKLAWSQAGGVQGEYAGYLALDVCTEGTAAEAVNISARMGSTRRYTSLAYVYLRYKLTGNSKKTDSPFAQSITTRITIRGRGAMLPDPRNPAHDMDDQSTWTWNDNASRNPALALLFYLLGWRINGKLAVGKGIPADRIDLDSFITAANICDELVAKPGGGTEPRYRCDGVWSEGDSPTTIIDMLKACMNADLDDVGGKLRLTVFHNDLATPIADFGDNDIIDAFSWQPLPPLDSTFNVVRGLYTDPSNNSLYQQVDYPEQRETSPDGIDRIDTFNLPMVQSPGQAQRLAQLRLQRQKFAGEFRAEFQANAWKVTKNSVIRLTFGQTGFVSKFFRVAEMDIRQDGVVPLVLREEDPAIYGDPPLTGAITPVFSTPFDPARSPFVQAINRWQGEYSPSATYVLDDLVTGPGNAGWRYINATPSAGNLLPVWPATSNSYWENFTPPVDPPDIGLEAGATRNVPRGTYDAGTTYDRGDTVIFSGSSYQLIVASSTGNAPPDVARWALTANAGSGPAGADGLPGLTVIVSNEAHVVATAPDGTGGDYSAAGGQMRLLRGDTVLTPTFSIPAKTPNTSWISIDSSGNFTVSDPGVDLATATLRATWAGVNYDRTYTLAKSKQGVTGPRLALVADNQAFTFTDGAANPGSQTITLTALLNNLSGTATWSTTPSVTLGGTGNTRTLSVASFGSNRQVTVEATLGGITDRITIVRLERNVVAPANSNRVPLSRMEGDSGWVLQFNGAGLSAPTDYGTFEGMRFFRVKATATAAGQTISIGGLPSGLPHFRLIPGERISFQTRVELAGAGAGNWFLALWGFRADGSQYAIPADAGSVASGSAPRFIANDPVRFFVTVPSDVVSARIEVYGVSGAAGLMDLVISEPMVTSAAPGQTVHPPFTPGPVLTGPVDAGGPLLIGQLPTDKAAPGLQNALVPLGNANRVPFSRFEGGQGWGIFREGSTGGTPYPNSFQGRSFIVADPVFTAASQNHYLFNSPPFSVNPGERLSVSAGIDAFTLSGPQPSFWQFYIDFLDGAGAFVSGATLSSGTGNGPGSLNARQQGFVNVPSNAVRAVINIRAQSAGAGQLRMAFLEPMVTSASAVQTVHPPYTPGSNSEDGGDITRTVSGPAEITMQFRADLALLSPLPLTADYQLGVAGASPLTSGVSWSVSVVSGSFTGTAPSIVGSGTGQLRINSALASPEATLRITPSVAGRASPPFVVRVARNVASPSLAPLTSIASSTFAQAHDIPIQITLPSSTSSVSLTAVADLLVNAEAPQGGTTVEGKWQRETSPGTWADVGAVATSSPNPEVFLDEPFPGEFFFTASPGSLTCNRTATGLTPGSIQRFRFVARVSLGNVRTVAFLGNASATA
jgi:hypothetical protein